MDGAIACVDAGKSVKLQQLMVFDRAMFVAAGFNKRVAGVILAVRVSETADLRQQRLVQSVGRVLQMSKLVIVDAEPQ